MKLARFSAIFALVLAASCDSPSKRNRIEINGAVSYAGQPIEKGEIVFEPVSTGIPMATGQIREGKFEIDAKDGPSVGSYIVRVEGYRKKHDPTAKKHPYAAGNQEVGVTTEQFLPAKHNVESTLTVEITREGENVHNFDLK